MVTSVCHILSTIKLPLQKNSVPEVSLGQSRLMTIHSSFIFEIKQSKISSVRYTELSIESVMFWKICLLDDVVIIKSPISQGYLTVAPFFYKYNYSISG